MEINIEIHGQPLDVLNCIKWAEDPGSGGINVFVGTVRNTTKGRRVLKLEFEAYEKMAKLEMAKIAEQASKKWNLERILIHHRTGTLEIGEIPVIITVSSAHRGETFSACQFIIDMLKQTVPIWKKEFFQDGEVWVAAHP